MTDTQTHTLSFNADFVRIAKLAQNVQREGGVHNEAKAVLLLTDGFGIPRGDASDIVRGSIDPQAYHDERVAEMFEQMKAHKAKLERELREATLVEEALF